MQFASRRSFCRRVTAFTDFERTIPPRLLWFPSSAFPLIATTRAIILTGSPDRIARHRASVGPRRPMTREKQPRRCYQFPPLLLTRSRECGERKTHPPIFTTRGIETTLLRSSHKLEMIRTISQFEKFLYLNILILYENRFSIDSTSKFVFPFFFELKKSINNKKCFLLISQYLNPIELLNLTYRTIK